MLVCTYLRFGLKTERNCFQEQLHPVGNIEIRDSEQLKVRHRKPQLKIRTEINFRVVIVEKTNLYVGVECIENWNDVH